MKKRNEYYELECLRYGEYCVIIEFCSNCSDHNNSLRHNAEKYLDKALSLKEKIQEEFPFIKIYLKPLQTQIKENIKRLGLFEINFGSFEQKEWILMGSKLRTLKWPVEKVVLNNIRNKFPSKTLYIDLKFDEAHFHPENNFKQNIKTMLVSYLDYSELAHKMNKKKEKSKTAHFDFQKKRKLSSIVEKKISSGIINEQEIEELLVNKNILIEQVPDAELKTKFVNVKPGRYKFMIKKNHNLQFAAYDVWVTPMIDDSNNH